ncbi:E3 SUMO-protein ligase ZBED1-like [Acanthochromis polyacanthus]|uniref:E3 SUMO-protein ligase ZBED1-like n=1 Tax=Acanthochromis polyacanthus TaxID=80966 RepID=UPI002234ACF1|nr:E3 SUMO-protein ligase ZBED1-like [Acanthochromis polyacanthus]
MGECDISCKALWIKAQYKYNHLPFITKALGCFITKDMQPFAVVEGAGFQCMIKALEPRYKIPSRKHFSCTVIPALYEETRRRLVNELSDTACVALTTDGWTSRATESFLTVTVHYIPSEWKMKSSVLQTRPLYESHTSEQLSEALTEAVTEWKLQRDSSTIPVTTDNAKNMVNAVNATAGLGPQIGCFAHTVNLAAKNAVSISQVSRLLGKIRKVVTFFHRSTTASHVLKTRQRMLELPAHKLIHDVSTRWNTTYDMLERYLEQQAAIYSALMEKDVKKHLKDISVLNDGEAKLAEDLIKILKPLKNVTTLMSTETSPSVSMIIPLQKMILKSMTTSEEDSSTIKDAKAAVTKDLEVRYGNPELQDYLHRTAALDPRFKSLPYLEEASVERIYSDVIREITEIKEQGQPREVQVDSSSSAGEPGTSGTSSPKKKSAMAEFLGEFFPTEKETTKTLSQTTEEEVMSYRVTGCIPVDADPLAWWKDNEHKYPHIAKLAQCYLTVQGTSVPSERVFSTAGDIVTASRSRLLAENVDKLIFLQKNLIIE